MLRNNRQYWYFTRFFLESELKMDSICEVPRSAPVPTTLEKIPAIPTVPEVSMIFQNSANINHPVDSIYMSYGEWKARHQNGPSGQIKHNSFQPVNSEATKCNPSSISRRQVRFESPVLLQQQSNHQFVSSNNVDAVSSNTRFSNPLQNLNTQNCDNPNALVRPNKQIKHFEQMYMANIPNRHLDLSIIDPPKFGIENKENIENKKPKTHMNSNNSKRPEDITPINARKNVPNYLKDVIFKNNSTQNDDNEHPRRTGDWFTATGNRSENMNDHRQKMKPLSSGITEKNQIIDMYNYNRDGFKNFSLDCDQRLTSNGKFDEKAKPVESNVPKNHLYPNTNVYESFTSHSCGNNACTCKCASRKELHENMKCDTATQPEISENACKNLETNKQVEGGNEETTVKDLLKIIQQQNDQLLVLQKQVAALLNSRDAPKQIDAPPAINRNVHPFSEKCRTSTQLETQEGPCNSAPTFLPKTGHLKQFSMDVMTSFEVSIRRPQNFNRARRGLVNHQPKICEITETDSDAFDQSQSLASNNVGNVLNGIPTTQNGVTNDTFKNTDVSLTFNEPIQVREPCPSPVNSVEIHMNDYSFDSDQEDATESAGWTFYNNMLQQVNHILKKSGIQPNINPSTGIDGNLPNPGKCNMKKVKEATIKHLRSIGVHVPATDDVDNSTEKDCQSNEVSFAVKQLLMKYLPDEQLAKITYMQKNNDIVSEKPGFIKRRPEFSFATVQYMQKYNLLNDVPNGCQIPQQPQVVQQNENFDRILDATAIRQQPKLL